MQNTSDIQHIKTDSLIFDMDGTLWDAVDSYVKIWNVTLDEAHIPHRSVVRADLMRLMGSYLDDIIAALVPGLTDRDALLKALHYNEETLMPVLGGRLYPGTRDVIAGLAAEYKLFMVSNCGPEGLHNFVTYTGLAPYFTDLLSHGMTGLPKAENIERLVVKYNLQRPVYVGDTQSDADQAAKAGIPIIWAKYGFGHIDRPDAVMDSITQLSQIVEKL